MTATAEHVLEEIRRLPPAALREVCEAVSQLAAQIPLPSPTAVDAHPPDTVVQTVDDLDEADEVAFFAALTELRQIGRLPRQDSPRFED